MGISSVEVRRHVSLSPALNILQDQVLSLWSSSGTRLPLLSTSLTIISPTSSDESQIWVPSPGLSPMIHPWFQLCTVFPWWLTLNVSNLEFNSTKTSFLHDRIPGSSSQLGNLESVISTLLSSGSKSTLPVGPELFPFQPYLPHGQWLSCANCLHLFSNSHYDRLGMLSFLFSLNPPPISRFEASTPISWSLIWPLKTTCVSFLELLFILFKKKLLRVCWVHGLTAEGTTARKSLAARRLQSSNHQAN